MIMNEGVVLLTIFMAIFFFLFLVQEVDADLQILKVLEETKGYSRIIYYENCMSNYIDSIMEQQESEYDTILMNIDNRCRFIRPNVSRCIFIIFLADEVNLYKISAEDELKANDIVFVASKTNSTENICLHDMFYGAGIILVGNLYRSELLLCRFFDNKQKVFLKKIDSRNIRKLSRNDNIFNFHGYQLIVGFTNLPPLFSECNRCKEPQFAGSEYELVKLVSSKLNFTYHLRQYYNTKNCGTKEQIIEDIQSKKLDIGVSAITLTYERSLKVSFSGTIFSQCYRVVFGKQHIIVNDNVTLIYSLIWFTFKYLLAIVVLIAAITKISVRYFYGTDKGILDYAKLALRIVVDQPIHNLSGQTNHWKPVIKIIFIKWWLTSYTLTTLLKVLLSVDRIRTKTKNWSNVMALIENGFTFEASPDDYSYLNTTCKDNSFDYCNRFLEKLQATADICKTLSNSLQSKSALLIETLPLFHVVQRNTCNFTKESLAQLKMFNLYTGNSFQSWMFRKSTPYIASFSSLLQDFQDYGFMQYLYTDMARGVDNYMNSGTSTDPTALNLAELRHPFTLLVLGYSLSIIIFFLEIFKIWKLWQYAKTSIMSHRNITIVQTLDRKL